MKESGQPCRRPATASARWHPVSASQLVPAASSSLLHSQPLRAEIISWTALVLGKLLKADTPTEIRPGLGEHTAGCYATSQAIRANT